MVVWAVASGGTRGVVWGSKVTGVGGQ